MKTDRTKLWVDTTTILDLAGRIKATATATEMFDDRREDYVSDIIIQSEAMIHAAHEIDAIQRKLSGEQELFK